MKLTLKQERFCHCYIEKGDATGAYRQAYNAEHMQPNTIRRKAYDLMRNPQITATIRLLQEELSAKMQIDNTAVLDEFSYVAFSDIRSFLDKAGRLLPVTAWPEGTARAVQSFKIRQIVDGGEPAEIIELKFWPKLPALESLSRHLGLFERDNKQRSTALSEILKEIDTGGLPAPPGTDG